MFIGELKRSFLVLVVLSILTGLVYPLAITIIAQISFPFRANGSLIGQDGKPWLSRNLSMKSTLPAGSELIGQSFDDPKYFWGRLSATDTPYNASNSSGSNFGPLNPALLKAVRGRIDALRKADPGNKASIPVDLVTASASGLDPAISPAAAYYQAGRVARIRRVPDDRIKQLIENHTDGRFLGLWGEPTVNILELNLALDNQKR